MKRVIILADSQPHYQIVQDYLLKGWVLDPDLTDGKPYRLENATVWPLVLFENEEEALKHTTRRGEFDDVVEVREVPHGDEVSRHIQYGFVVHAIYAKSTIMIKRRQ